jgi:hypothetical protein
MRGVAPRTVAWALYRQGNKQPAETGILDVSALSSHGWVAVRTLAPQLMTLAAQSSPRPTARSRAARPAILAERTFSETNLALVPVKPPAQIARRATPKHGASRTAKSRARRA